MLLHPDRSRDHYHAIYGREAGRARLNGHAPRDQKVRPNGTRSFAAQTSWTLTPKRCDSKKRLRWRGVSARVMGMTKISGTIIPSMRSTRGICTDSSHPVSMSTLSTTMRKRAPKGRNNPTLRARKYSSLREARPYACLLYTSPSPRD